MTPADRPILRSASADWLRALERTASVVPDSTRTLAVAVEERAAAAPDSPALIGTEGTLTYAALTKLMRRVARWALADGLVPGDRVALMMGNAPAYSALWLGLSRVGVVTALINTQLSGDGLVHALAAAAPSHVVVGSGCFAAAATIAIDPAMRRSPTSPTRRSPTRLPSPCAIPRC